MVLVIVLGIAAFVALAAMSFLLWTSSRREDPITEAVIVKANTGAVKVTQENGQ